MHEAYLSHVKVQITASRKDIYLVLVYGITEHPMMLAANKKLGSEEDVIKAAIIQTADPIKEKVSFCYCRRAKGVSGILSDAKEGVRLWFRTKRPAYHQICLKLAG